MVSLKYRRQLLLFTSTGLPGWHRGSNYSLWLTEPDKTEVEVVLYFVFSFSPDQLCTLWTETYEFNLIHARYFKANRKITFVLRVEA